MVLINSDEPRGSRCAGSDCVLTPRNRAVLVCLRPAARRAVESRRSGFVPALNEQNSSNPISTPSAPLILGPAGLSRLRRALQIWLRPRDALPRTAVELRSHPALNEQNSSNPIITPSAPLILGPAGLSHRAGGLAKGRAKTARPLHALRHLLLFFAACGIPATSPLLLVIGFAVRLPRRLLAVIRTAQEDPHQHSHSGFGSRSRDLGRQSVHV